jgi:hypothetical protein
VIKTELQSVLNTFTEHNFQDAFEKWHKHREWGLLEGDGGQ